MDTRDSQLTPSTTAEITCMVCCEDSDCFSIGACDHPICFKCSARMRVLSNQKYCPSCRTELDQVVYCSQLKKFNEFVLSKMLSNRKFGIRFETAFVRKRFDALLDYVCIECGEGPLGSMQDLKSHIRKEHEKQFCLICIKNVVLFPSERKLYNKKELVRHRKDGDADEKSHRGHPECRFCDERYFDNDALLLHLRKSHFWCHFCEHDGKQDYYDVYESLRRHFADQHFLCDEDACANEKFTSVFRDKIDFQAHKLAAHRKKLNKYQAKNARKVDIDYNFGGRSSGASASGGGGSTITGADYEDVRQSGENRGASGGRSAGRSNNNNHRYHREKNGTLNFYDYEDVEKDRKKFLGKARRHEAEEVTDNNERAKVGRRMAATRSLSQSEPDIPSNYNNQNITLDDDVIGFTERLGDHTEKPKPKEKIKPVVNKTKERQPSPSPPPPPPPQQQQQTKPKVVKEDFPSLPGAKHYIPPTSNKKRADDFPALPKAAASKPKQANWGTNNKDMKVLNGVVVKTAKTKKKGKTKNSKVTDENDFPSLGRTPEKSAPPPSKFNTFVDETNSTKPVQNGGSASQKKYNENNVSKEKSKHEKQSSNQHSSPKPSSRPPPGLSTKPPGFSTKPPGSSTKPPGLSSKPPGLSASKPTASAPPPGYASQPADTSLADRNMRLLGMLTKFLDDFNMSLFKDLSGKLRRGQITAKAYYDGINELLGRNLKYVFSELVALLPDERKQSELLQVHNDAKIKTKQIVEERREKSLAADYTKPQTWGAKTNKTVEEKLPESTCEKCGVTVRNDLIQEHLESHGEAFPALPVTTKKKKNYSFNPTVRHTRQNMVKSAWSK